MTGAALVFLAVATVWLWRRVRGLERRLEDLKDRATDWRIHLAREQEALRERLEGAAAAPRPAAPEGGEPLLQIRSRPRPAPTETTTP